MPKQNIQNNNNSNIQKYALQAIMYKIAAAVCGFAGIWAFISVYVYYSDGDYRAFFDHPLLILLMLLPFLPAYILMLIADKKKRKILNMRMGKT